LTSVYRLARASPGSAVDRQNRSFSRSREASSGSLVDNVAMTSGWAEEWQRSWDRLEDGYIPERERQIDALVDVVEAVAGPSPIVVDLACGTGSVTRRLLARLPTACSIAVDIDPVLLTIAEATFHDDDRVTVASCDLRDPSWIDAVPKEVDAVVTSTALHWLEEDVVRRLYCELAGLVRRGGVAAHVEQMPLVDVPRLADSLGSLASERLLQRRADRPDWDAWWAAAAADPALVRASSTRAHVFPSSYPATEFSPPADWHVRTLLDAGFSEAAVVWRAGAAALVAAVR
jgi:trans-aconitate methyltransferase